jgi:hypothetical protein
MALFSIKREWAVGRYRRIQLLPYQKPGCAFGDAGMVITSNANFAEKVRALRQ